MAMDTSKTIAAAEGGDTTASCWSCGDMRAAHFCHACFTGQYQIGFDAGERAQLKLFDS